jgi:uncharacterized protein (UPF0303 family)
LHTALQLQSLAPSIKISLKLKPTRFSWEQLSEILAQEQGLVLQHFTADDAFEIGVALRARLRTLSEQPAVVNIALANGNNLLFHAASRPGVLPDNDSWVARKRKTVLRWGVSSWYMHHKMGGDEAAFAAKYALGNDAGSYASKSRLSYESRAPFGI